MAKKAAVIIGVNKTGGLTPLKSAASCADEVANWLVGEGYDVECITDRTELVTVDRVTSAIEKFVTSPPDITNCWFTFQATAIGKRAPTSGCSARRQQVPMKG